MKREIIVTTDGSHSIVIPEMGVTYHSSHGAIQESMHVFIESGLRYWLQKHSPALSVSILELGFGTGLNALLSLVEAEKTQVQVYYETIEPYPLDLPTVALLNYCEQLGRPDLNETFTQLHNCAWEETIPVSPHFNFKKRKIDFANYVPAQLFNIVFFDAFAPDIQPALWTAAVFKKLYAGMHAEGVLTTYCSKSIVRKAMVEAGWKVEKIPGPPHKREMVRAGKQ